MSNEVIVLVSDPEDANHGELNTLASQEEAARLIESLLESGFEAERIRAFHATKIAMHVSHRPVVALVGGSESAPIEPEAETAEEDDPSEAKWELVAVGATAKAETQREVAARPYMRDGVRFSSLFGPA